MPNPNEVVVKRVSGAWVCEPDPVRPQGQNATIKFRLDDNDYKFRDTNAVVVQQPGSQFPEPSKTEDKKTAKLKDLNTEEGRFKYSVFVVKEGTTTVEEIDPVIENRPR